MPYLRTAVSLGLAALLLSAAGCRKNPASTGAPANAGQPASNARLQEPVSPDLKPALDALAAIAKELKDTRQDIRNLGPQPGDRPLAPPPSPGIPVRRLHTLDNYVPCLFSEENTAFFRGKQVSQAMGNAVREELRIQADAARITDLNAVLQLLKNANTSQYGDLVDVAVAKKWIVQGPADASLKSASDAVKAALNRAADALQGVESYKIGCSQSILTYAEAHDIYGQRVARTYIPIQVVVRNLDPDHEFLMHDVQIAVDAMRFVGGRDKILARGVAEVGQSEDPRNRWIRVAEALGDVASAASIPLTSRDFKNGVAVFRSGLIPGLKNIFPDYTIAQLNRMNDTGFSASTSYKIVIPKNGSVPVVTFLPVDIYGYTATDPVTGQPNTAGRAAFPKKYKDWSREQLQWLQENTYVVFTGVHITEVDQNKPALAKLDCPLSGGRLDLSKAANGVLTCNVGGDNLTALNAIRLKSAVESGDRTSADGAVTLESDGKGGTVAFKTADLDQLQGLRYGVYTVSKTGQENSTTLEVQLVVAVSAISPDTFTAASCGDCAFVVSGSHLDAIQAISLVSLKLNERTGAFERVGGVKYTIKDGIVYDAKKLLADVAAMVERAKADGTQVR